jgi:Domain of unknown function (DUF305)
MTWPNHQSKNTPLLRVQAPRSAQGHDHHNHGATKQRHQPGHGGHSGPPGNRAHKRDNAVCSARQAGNMETAEYTRFTETMHADMDKMMRDMHANPPSGDPDIDFLLMMIPHHAGAIDMTRHVLRSGRDPLVREIAEKILAAQVSEVEGMRGRLAALRSCAQNYPSLTGNRGE